MSSKGGFKPKKAAAGAKKPAGKGARPQPSQKRKRESPQAKGKAHGHHQHGNNKKNTQTRKEEPDEGFEEVQVEEDESWESDEEVSAMPKGEVEHDEFVEFGEQSDDDEEDDDSENNNDDDDDDDGDADNEEDDEDDEEDDADEDEGDSMDVEEEEEAASVRRARAESSKPLDSRASRALELRSLTSLSTEGDENAQKLIDAHARAVGEAAYERELFYDSEDSENERELVTVGDVPLEWYDDYDHIGYDLEGKKVSKSSLGGEGEISRLLAQDEHPWSVYNARSQRRELISAADMAFVQQMRKGIEQERYAPEKWHIQLDTYTDTVHATSQAPEPKRRFLPSKWEARRVRRLAYAIKMGWLKLDEAVPAQQQQFSLIWSDQDAPSSTALWTAPKPKLPGHAESYNPPSEYLFDEDEQRAWEELDEHERPIKFLPKQNSSLRTTPSYANFQRERFERMLDLYLAVRSQRTRSQIDPNALLPRLPKPSELKPFPSLCALTYTGHAALIKSVDIDVSGRWIASADESGALHVYELTTGRLSAKWSLGTAIAHVAWSPREDVLLLAVAVGDRVELIHVSALASVPQMAAAQALFSSMDEALKTPSENKGGDLSSVLSWHVDAANLRAHVTVSSKAVGAGGVSQVAWHHKGDYVASVCPQATLQRAGVLVHQLSRARSQAPFKKLKGHVQAVRFHPSKPFLFVGTQRHVRVYNLLEQKLQRTVHAGVPWLSSMALHPSGDHVLCSGYDSRVAWLDLDMSTPYKILRYHKQAVRNTRFHPRYPLFASCSDDGAVHVFHGGVTDDLSQMAFIVPLKVLRGHTVTDELGVIDIAFHPTQPWIVSGAADTTLKLWVNVG